MPAFTDQTGSTITLEKNPVRIVSLVPSQTELLADLGLEEGVVGITKFCIHPNSWFQQKARIGGTKELNLETIRALRPDLIIANKEENVKDQVEELKKHYPVWISDVNNIEGAYEMMISVGKMTGKTHNTNDIIASIKSNFKNIVHPAKKIRAAYLIWRNPYMTVGGDTFINAMMQEAGFENIYANENRYPEIDIASLNTGNCERLLLSSEPFPFTQKHIDELQPLIPKIKIQLVDGEMFSWYGSRMMKAAHYFATLNHDIA